jgi:DNA-binding XRE family transcriptional regulator
MDWPPERIRELRKKYSLTQKGLGQLLGVSKISIYQWERGFRNPSRTTQILLSRIEEEMKIQNRKEVKKHGSKG